MRHFPTCPGAGSAEQIAATAPKLSGNAARLNALVARFKVGS